MIDRVEEDGCFRRNFTCFGMRPIVHRNNHTERTHNDASNIIKARTPNAFSLFTTPPPPYIISKKHLARAAFTHILFTFLHNSINTTAFIKIILSLIIKKPPTPRWLICPISFYKFISSRFQSIFFISLWTLFIKVLVLFLSFIKRTSWNNLCHDCFFKSITST